MWERPDIELVEEKSRGAKAPPTLSDMQPSQVTA